MKDKIKEILDNLKDIDKTSILKNNDAKILLDYITNLQEKYDKALTDLVHESHKRIELENKTTNLQQENHRLMNNWNELKKYINKMIEKDKKYTDIASRYGVLNCKSILDKINELEGKNEKQEEKRKR